MPFSNDFWSLPVPQPSSPASSYTLKYDAWNRLVEVKDGSTVVQANEFDGFNRRIVRDESGGSSDERHFYYNNQWQVLEERVGTSTLKYQYVYHPYYVDSVLVRYDASSTKHYYLHDANFNVIGITNNGKNVIERYSYTPYGEVVVLDADYSTDANNISDINNEYLYTGRRLDPETGLQLNRNRFYHAPLGRWVNRDPIGYDGSQWNLYEYLNGRPSIALDPFGLGWMGDFWEWLWGTGSTVGAPPPVGALEAAPDGADIYTLTELKRIAVETELEFGSESKKARKAWKEYEDAKEKQHERKRKLEKKDCPPKE